MSAKKSQRRGIYIDPDLYEKVREDAEKLGQNISEYITHALIERYHWRSNCSVPCRHCNRDNIIQTDELCWFCGNGLTARVTEETKKRTKRELKNE